MLLAKAPRLAQAGSILMSTIKQIDGNYSEKPCDHPKLKDLHDVQPHPPPLWITLRILRSCLLRGRTDNAGPGWSEFHEPYILCVFPKALSLWIFGESTVRLRGLSCRRQDGHSGMQNPKHQHSTCCMMAFACNVTNNHGSICTEYLE